MPDLKEILKNSLFNQVDDSVSAPISIRLPTILNNELDELSLSLDRSKRGRLRIRKIKHASG